MKARSITGLIALTIVVGLPQLSAQDADSKKPFKDLDVLIESKDGLLVILRNAEVRTLANRQYLVGYSLSIGDGVLNHELNEKTQWVAVDNIRRMAEGNWTGGRDRDLTNRLREEKAKFQK